MIDLNSNQYIINEPDSSVCVTAAAVFAGKQVPPRQHIFLYTADDWEVFISEWAQYQKSRYHKIVNLGGANDFGIDVAAFYSDRGFQGDWDNYQCKYYKSEPLSPATAIPEIAKILWHAFKQEISLPTKYYFFAPKDCGPSLKKLLLDKSKLVSKLKSEWNNWCATTITSTLVINLEGDFLDFVDKVDFSIFQYKPTSEVIEEHRQTPYFVQRFGGGLPDRPTVDVPPSTPLEIEFRYISQIFEAYSDKENQEVNQQNISSFSKLDRHFNRQREAFFHAESLKSFARDTVPHGTFASLQGEILSGVIDVCEDTHPNGFERLKAVSSSAQTLNLDTNGLIQVTKIQDRHGICHQLANEDKLTWVPDDE